MTRELSGYEVVCIIRKANEKKGEVKKSLLDKIRDYISKFASGC